MKVDPNQSEINEAYYTSSEQTYFPGSIIAPSSSENTPSDQMSFGNENQDQDDEPSS